MKKTLILLLGLLLFSGAVYAERLDIEEKISDVTVKNSINNNPPVVGENKIAIELLDTDGIPITDAEVELYYFMPTMPAMNYTASAGLTEGKYTAVIKLVMPGPWDVDVKFKKPDSEMHKVTVSFDIK